MRQPWRRARRWVRHWCKISLVGIGDEARFTLFGALSLPAWGCFILFLLFQIRRDVLFSPFLFSVFWNGSAKKSGAPAPDPTPTHLFTSATTDLYAAQFGRPSLPDSARGTA